MIPAEIQQTMRDVQFDARQIALEKLAEHDVTEGALIEVLHWETKERTGEVYRITSIGLREIDSLWLHGQKLRRDDTFGTHVHSITSPDCIRVLEGPIPPREMG